MRLTSESVFWTCCSWVLLLTSAVQADGPTYRTDGGDEKLPWYQLADGVFPPADAAHAISGELIRVDPIARQGAIRMDRTGAQRTDEYDQALEFTLLPYASMSYHGAPCELRDIPLGTHLHGKFFEDQQGNKKSFGKTLRLVDDFTRLAEAHHAWRIEAIDLGKGTLTAMRMDTDADKAVDPQPTVFQISPATRVWKERSIGQLGDVAAGQVVFMNLTVCTLKGPGRCLDIWIDPISREVAKNAQLETHRLYQHEHGLACAVTEVDNKQKIVTVTVFAGFDPELRNGFKLKDGIAAAVANNDLRTHDQNNDTARGPIVETTVGEPSPGQSGWKLRFSPDILLEGYRPGRILRIFGAGWRVDDVPREERAYDG